ncbi:MAG TPA: hypothetical protein PK331_07830 [Gordonia sp. (in: high G+C Gram-positive bacteria)]|uniref:hypothetical protein n=1 Tax=Gordonia sp. (in: high G+C Gram-positive bacteria) TaxID=84139 RepID=UPI000F954C27|nr:hypothetical protein [Gordonia sp. (in: high G+C Gram-positive bacteria)]RUP38956.1 MAG: hypothetical protein EKK60_08385 [Gordonia sp. (in: high G+C Gram-positive bacteria)]HNP56432.1 hypothetical protein [Gordonia sp. (in: high G+C Gram-positive bacteria)]HRC50815.1 hypothetical protein [Gordonia sp. (in: high G+C Gram-positive bacteria)]
MSAASRAFPEPPFTPELIADFHAGALDEALAHHVQQRLPDDPEAMETLAALDATVEALRTSSVETVVPSELRATSEATLARLELTSPAVTPAPVLPSGPAPHRRHTALLAVAAMVTGVLAAGIGIGVLLLPRPTSSGSAGEVPAAEAAVLLAAARAPQTEPLDINRLARCLTANRLGGQSIVGAGYLDYEGAPAQVILTPTGQSGRFHALITRRDCDAGRPGTIARTVIGE